MTALDIAKQAAESIQKLTGQGTHDIAIIIGSGWAKSVEMIGTTTHAISASELPGFQPPLVPGHLGQIRSISLNGEKRALALGARSHLYEGNGVAAAVHQVRTAAACGAKVLIITNGAGGLNENWVPGQPILISDHINLTATSPLEGASFVDLTDLYSKRLRDLAKRIDSSLEEGVYVQLRGPNYETPAEVKMVRGLGGDLVGMSTALEAIAAREAGLEILGLSLITNLGAGLSNQPLSHQEVIDAGKLAEPKISRLLADIVLEL